MKGFQGPFASAQIPHFSEDNMNNLQKIPKKITLFGWVITLFGWVKTPFQILDFFGFFLKKTKFSKKIQQIQKNPKKSKNIQNAAICLIRVDLQMPTCYIWETFPLDRSSDSWTSLHCPEVGMPLQWEV